MRVHQLAGRVHISIGARLRQHPVQRQHVLPLSSRLPRVPSGRHGRSHQRLERAHDLQEQRVAAGAGNRLVKGDVVRRDAIEVVTSGLHRGGVIQDRSRILIASVLRREFGRTDFERPAHVPDLGGRHLRRRHRVIEGARQDRAVDGRDPRSAPIADVDLAERRECAERLPHYRAADTKFRRELAFAGQDVANL